MRFILLSIISFSFLLQISCTSPQTGTVSGQSRPVRPDALKSIQIKSAQKWGYINDTGALVIPPIYDYAWDFSDGLGRVHKDNECFFINSKGEIALFDSTKENFCDFNDGLAWVSMKIPGEKYPRYGVMNKKGQMITAFKYSWGNDFNEGISVAYNEDSTYLIDTTGRVVFATTDTVYGPVGNGLAITIRNGKYGYLNKKGELVIPCEYDKAYEFKEGRALVYKEKLCGFIDATGKVVVPIIYDGALHFSCGRAPVRKDGNLKWGYIDREGELVIPMKYDYFPNTFTDGYTMVSMDRKRWFIDTNGNKVYDINPAYEYPGFRYDGNVTAIYGDKEVLIMKYGKDIILP